MSLDVMSTVGTFDRPEWGFGANFTFSPGEQVRVRQPIPAVVVQVIGGSLPPWATSAPHLDAQPSYEIILVYEAPWTASDVNSRPERLGYFHPTHRFIVHDERLTEALSRPEALPTHKLRIASPVEAITSVAEALAILTTGQLVAGASVGMLFEAIGCSEGWLAIGQAAAFPGLLGCDTGRIFLPGKHPGRCGLLVMQLVRREEGKMFCLRSLIDLTTVNSASKTQDDPLVTASVEAHDTALVVISFDHKIAQ